MIEIKLKNTALCFDFSFFAVMALCFFLDNNGICLLSLSACVCHELSHLAVMLICSADINAVVLYGAGMKINCELSVLSTGKRLAVLAAGCAMNFMLCICALWFGFYEFAAINLVIGVFNLLSVGSLDGAQMTDIISLKHPLCAKLMHTVSLIVVICVGASAIAFGKHLAPTYFVTVIYMLLLKCKGY
ncbi:MAG: hypothetical protein IJD85_03830 [Oscillospiraceae bacterium]|nr:hypothetical protein [Oscillospiraceae bacterium]